MAGNYDDTDLVTHRETARENFKAPKDKKVEDKKGYYKGRVYYAANKPKGTGEEISFDSEKYNTVLRAMSPDANRELVGEAMNYLMDIGYYDGPLDSLKGKMFMGAGQRLQYNKADDAFLEEAKDFDFMKWIRGKFNK